MVTETLVEPLIEHGQKLIDQYRQDGHSIVASFWAKTPVDGNWYLYLVIDNFAADGPNKSYRGLYASWARIKNPWVQYSEIKLIDKDDPVAQSIQEITARYGTDLATSLRKPTLLGNVPFDEIYIYAQK